MKIYLADTPHRGNA